MPRGKATKSKACQTDTVFLSEDQVEAIVSKRLSQEIEKLKSDFKASNQGKDEINEQLSKLQQEVNVVQNEIDNIKTSSEKLTNDVDSLNNLQQVSDVSIEQLQTDLNTIEQMCDKNKGIHDICRKIDELEQQNKLKNLRIFGLKEEKEENVQQKLLEFAKTELEIELQHGEIEARRMGKVRPENLQPRDILVTFNNQTLRNAVYRKKKLLRERNVPVFINEDLTTKRSLLFFQARQLRKRGKLFAVWTQEGNILIRTGPESNPKSVNNIDDIKTILNEECSNGDTNSEGSVTSYEEFEDLLN